MSQQKPAAPLVPVTFPRCSADDLGFYPIVNSSSWLERLAPVGVGTFQLRIKDKQGDELEQEISRGVELAKKYGFHLYINDFWDLAIRYGAYGVHLGQGDLQTADIQALSKAGLHLGISTHIDDEVAIALAVQPSYLAIGPVFPTTLKVMPYTPHGIAGLQAWRQKISLPLVAIGGITRESLPAILSCGVEGVAVVSAVVNAPDPKAAARFFLQQCQSIHTKR